MVLTFVRGWDNIPKNATVLSEDEAFSHQLKLINGWEKPSEVFFLKYGNVIAGLTAGLSSFPVVNHFRKHLKLNSFGVLSTYAPGFVMPAFLTFVGYEKLVRSEIILMKMRCPLCMQFKYAAYHVCTSLFYSIGISALTCASVALNRKTRYVPDPKTEGKLCVKFFWDVIKGGAQRYQAITLFQLVIVLFLPYLQVQEFNNIVKLATERESNMFKSRDSISSEYLPE